MFSKIAKAIKHFIRKLSYLYGTFFLNHRYPFILTNCVFILLNQVYMGHTLPPSVYLDISEVYPNLVFVGLSPFFPFVCWYRAECVGIVPSVCLYHAKCVFVSCSECVLFSAKSVFVSCSVCVYIVPKCVFVS